MRIAAENCTVAGYVVLEFARHWDASLDYEQDVPGHRHMNRCRNSWAGERVVIPPNHANPVDIEEFSVRQAESIPRIGGRFISSRRQGRQGGRQVNVDG